MQETPISKVMFQFEIILPFLSVMPAQAGIQRQKSQLDHMMGDGYRLRRYDAYFSRKTNFKLRHYRIPVCTGMTMLFICYENFTKNMSLPLITASRPTIY